MTILITRSRRDTPGNRSPDGSFWEYLRNCQIAARFHLPLVINLVFLRSESHIASCVVTDKGGLEELDEE